MKPRRVRAKRGLAGFVSLVVALLVVAGFAESPSVMRELLGELDTLRAPASKPTKSNAPPADEASGLRTVKLLRVVDGDSVEVADEERTIRVRLHGIDAPEGDQPGGNYAKRYLASLLIKPIRLKVVETDAYGRTVGRLIVGPTQTDTSVRMVCDGVAWWYERHARNDRELARCQQSARGKAVGMWADGRAVPPWEWRRRGLDGRR